VVTVGPLERKIIDEVTNIYVAQQFAVSVAKVSQNLPLEDGSTVAVNLESPKSALVVRPACHRVVS